MELILLPICANEETVPLDSSGNGKGLKRHYKRALDSAVELYIVSAYLTEWDAPAPLNKSCCTFRLIVGQDFGITRKEACRKVMKWLPKTKKHCFKVAEEIEGFHPKAMFWREGDGSLHALVGSSNLTSAAFSKNHEANIYTGLNQQQFDQVIRWISHIEQKCVAVSEDWLSRYREAPMRRGQSVSGMKKLPSSLLKILKLPLPPGAKKQIKARQAQLKNFLRHQPGLLQSFQDCAAGRKTSAQFYEDLPNYWSGALNDRLQGSGWERTGKNSDFQLLSQSFLAIVNATASKRDDVVASQIDWLHTQKVASRGAFLSEMLCLWFPDLYPVLNQPIQDYLAAIKFKGPSGASEGAYYVDLAQRLRMSLRANPTHPAKTLAELDTVIWLVYG